MNKVYLHIGTLVHLCVIHGYSCTTTGEINSKNRMHSLQSLKYLLSGLLQKSFPGPSFKTLFKLTSCY